MSVKIHIEIEGADELLAEIDWKKLKGIVRDIPDPGPATPVTYVDEAKEAELQRSGKGADAPEE